MLARILAIRSSAIIALFVPIAALAMSWSFRMHAIGRLGGPLRFELRDDSDKKNVKVGQFTSVLRPSQSCSAVFEKAFAAL